jgi:site-specific recombinase XerD
MRFAGIKGKAIGWHSFRHSLATNLRAAGVDLKTAQERFAPRKLTDHARCIHTSDLRDQA